jgi:hypothetical protein
LGNGKACPHREDARENAKKPHMFPIELLQVDLSGFRFGLEVRTAIGVVLRGRLQEFQEVSHF